MAEIGGNFVNPAYASPEQIKFLRQYAQQLMTPGPVAHWAQGVGNIARALVGGYEARQADTQEQQSNLAFQKGLSEAVKTGDISTVLGAAGHPRANAAMIAALAGQLHPAGTETYSTPGATLSTPAPSNIERTYPRAPIIQAPLPPAGGEPARPGQQNLTSGEITGIQKEDIPPGVSPGDYVKRGFADAGISPPQTAQTSGLPPRAMERLDALQQKGLLYGQQSAANKAIQEQTSEEIKTGFASFPVIQTLNTMEDLIDKHGDNMPFGPTAEWLNELRRGLAQHAPGLFTEKDFKGLAAADELKKLSAWLSTAVGRQAGGTDLSLMQGRDSVPGQHNSKEGAKSLIDMMRQVQVLNARFAMDNANNFGKPGFNLLAEKEKFFATHPIINKLTGNPIRIDLSAKNKQGQTPEQGGGGWSIIR